ncbi:NAD(P)H-dependent oxidoreductase subunit E [Plebeiibacterium sediminum]|uniref:NAD(P)H-dependent oxidoreductase subunit E n=1 Tax=Plebeiibacterium sediminum TaxID=2992112 RepID=A0AAE3M145_9BACT|nr:NAD(P)H-dependent oxidoreductase subunit E [Plebeiobacterium sediminum]MCW3785272.1 NAD(P)H-dependent oxidoreductase subunit E [Plebeiobacterium sediminum]
MSRCQCDNNSKVNKEELIATMDAIIERVGTSKDVIIPLLQEIQDEFSYLPSEALERIYERTEIDRAQLISVSTFYSQFRHIPYGKHLIKVCTGTACHVKGATNVYDSFKRELKMEGDSITTDDQLFSIEKVACLGCCTLAPVVQIDDKIYGHVLPGKVNEVIEEFIEEQSSEEKKASAKKHHKVAGEIRLGMGSCCQASGSSDIYNELQRTSNELGIEVDIKSVGCVGVCNKVPLIDVVSEDGSIKRYPNVKASEIKEILHYHFKPAGYFTRLKNSLINRVDTYHTDLTWDNVIWKPENERTGLIDSFLASQKHISTEGFGYLAPLDLNEYRKHEGFDGLQKVLTDANPKQLVEDILNSGLRGRGGGGFPTGKKWEIVAASDKTDKYVICNGDEGDPGAFMDRMILESYPFRVIEGMVIAGYAVGANRGVFYIRAEYPLAVKRIQRALELCREQNLIGSNILGSDFSFDISIFEGAGAFVCGEETALIASIEGDRGFPKQRPPYPAVSGLHACPTLVNNVETLSQISYVIRNGVNTYNQIGTENSKGTKVFALAGKIKNGGLIEVPMGISLNQIIEEIGGGVEKDEKLKAVQIGGPSGGCIPANLCDVKVDFDAFNQMGAMMGSGGLVVLSEKDCMVDMARYFLTFTSEQSCGKCTFCRVGTKRMLDILDKLCSGKAQMEDIDKLEELAINVKRSSLCGLGKTAPNPVLTTLKYFREEYEEHVQGICKTGTCKDMIEFEVTEDCIGCTKCAKACPVDAIPYEPYKVHHIDTELCVKCGLCIDECSYDAIIKVKKEDKKNG